MKYIIALTFVLLMGCSDQQAGREEIYNISMRNDTLVAAGDYTSARTMIHVFLSEPLTTRGAYDSLLVGHLYAWLAFFSRRDSTYQYAEPGIDRAAYPFYALLPDTKRVHLYRWSARSALAGGDPARAFRLLAESYHLAIMLGDSLEEARTRRLWMTISRSPREIQIASPGGFPLSLTLLFIFVIGATALISVKLTSGVFRRQLPLIFQSSKTPPV